MAPGLPALRRSLTKMVKSLVAVGQLQVADFLEKTNPIRVSDGVRRW